MISLIHPSRGRPEKSLATCLNWIERSGLAWDNIELIISNDGDDICLPSYIDNIVHHLCKYISVSHCVDRNTSVVQASNHAAMTAKGDVFIYLSDDFDCPENWGDAVLREFDGATGPRLVKVYDCLQPFYVKVLTIPIMNRALYERLGYFWNPQYKSMFCDEDLYHTANKLGALWSAPHLKFEHKHVSVGKAEDDETYRRSSANWKQGEEVFNRRKKQGFPV